MKNRQCSGRFIGTWAVLLTLATDETDRPQAALGGAPSPAGELSMLAEVSEGYAEGSRRLVQEMLVWSTLRLPVEPKRKARCSTPRTESAKCGDTDSRPADTPDDERRRPAIPLLPQRSGCHAG